MNRVIDRVSVVPHALYYYRGTKRGAAGYVCGRSNLTLEAATIGDAALDTGWA